jgi:hypothetical protein
VSAVRKEVGLPLPESLIAYPYGDQFMVYGTEIERLTLLAAWLDEEGFGPEARMMRARIGL